MSNQIIKEQFNKQAVKFANWSVSKNVEYLNAYFEFCGIRNEDSLLDVACGPGEFTIFIAKRIRKAKGVDISDKEVEIGNNLAKEFGLNNISFDCHDVEHLPYEDNSFSVVLCKSALHHFTKPEKVFKEMVRCCKKGGLISLQDIMAYDDYYVNDFFETFEKYVDVSHNRTLSENEINNLYNDLDIQKTGEYKVTVDLNMREYLEHAVQNEESKIKIKELLERGLNDSRLKDYIFIKSNELYFKRHVFLIKGTKSH